MSRNVCLFRSKCVCALLLACIFLSPSVFADGFSLSSSRGFDDSVSVNSTPGQNADLSLLTLIQMPSTTTHKVVSQWNTAQACNMHYITLSSNTGNAAFDVLFLNGQDFTATDISSVFGHSAPANTLWTLGRQDILWTLLNALAEKIAAAPRITDSTT